MTAKLRRLPKGISSFEVLRKGDYIYVDKTEQIYHLIDQGQYYFLSRPRRFGKSLLISTLKELFEANRALFKGLWIDHSDYLWDAYPVINISFFKIMSGNAIELRLAITEQIDDIARNNKIDLSHFVFLEAKFAKLIEKLAEKNRVVVLIDEYDHAILRNITNLSVADECRQVLQSFYGVLKDVDKYLRFVFITGVSKFIRTSIFSGLNNLDDITMDKAGATLLGYTHSELLENFKQHIAHSAHELTISSPEVITQMTEWYDGYQFSQFTEIKNESAKVYNPYSVLLFLSKSIFGNYWFETGSPRFLLDLIKEQEFQPVTLNDIRLRDSELGNFQIDRISLPVLLYQTGYLTIQSYNPSSRIYTLKMPNKEVEVSFLEQVLSLITDVRAVTVDTCLVGAEQALNQDNIDSFCLSLQTFFAAIPLLLHSRFENYYQSIIFVILKLSGFITLVEEQTNLGRIDLVMQTSSTIFIMEFKTRGSAQEALKQIEDRQYAQKYLLSSKKIILVGIFIDVEKPNITDWVVKEIAH